MAGAASDQLYSILMDTPPENDLEGDEHAPREIGGVSPPNTLEIRWMPAARRRRHAGRVGAGRTRSALRAQRRIAGLLHDQSRPAVDHPGRLRPAHACSALPGPDPATTRRARTTSGSLPTAIARSSTSRASTTSSRRREPAARRSKCASRAAAIAPPCRSRRCRSKAATTSSGALMAGPSPGPGARSSSGSRSTPPNPSSTTSSSSCRARSRTARCC